MYAHSRGPRRPVARELGVAMICAVVDSGDQLVAFERMDGPTWPGSRWPATRRSPPWSTGCRRPTSHPIVQPGTEFYGYASVAGGRTIVFRRRDAAQRDGVLVGAVGVSGGDGSQDQQAVEAAVRAFGGGR